MSWHTVEIRPGLLSIMDDDQQVGILVQGENSWLVDLHRQSISATFQDYTSCLAFVHGVEMTTPTPLPITVKGGDYTYDGWIVARFPKRKSGQIRYVVEDENGRLFIHNGKQIGAE